MNFFAVVLFHVAPGFYGFGGDCCSAHYSKDDLESGLLPGPMIAGLIEA
jgi:hypothetical protein